MYDLSGKSVIYVGGFGGVGYQICRILVKKGINQLVICSQLENMEMLQKLRSDSTTTKVDFVHINIADRVSIQKGVKQVVEIVGKIDVLINGVGVLADKDVETTIGVNMTGLINTTMAFLPYMDKTQKGRGGVVVNLSSVFGLEPGPAFPVYTATKHGVVGFTRSMGVDHFYNKTGVSFICICPGLTTSERMMNLRENVTLKSHSERLGDDVKQQSPEECAASAVKAIEIMKNGGIYICNLGQLKEVVPSVYWPVL